MSPIAPAIPSLALLIAVALLAAPVAAAGDEISYDTKFEGVGDPVLSDLQAVSQLVALSDKQPNSLSALKRRADADLDRMQQAIRADGYYDAHIDVATDPGGDKGSYVVTVTVDPGPVYRLAEIVIRQPDGRPPPEPVTPDQIGLALDQPAVSGPVLGAEARIVRLYTGKGWPFARITDRRVEIDTATKTMHVTYILDPGGKARFGRTTISGLTRLDPDYVENRIKWRDGAPFDQSVVDDTRQKLVSSGLFGLVTIGPVGPIGADGTVPMSIALVERSDRTVTGGLSYDTSLGLEAKAGWEHRDLFGDAEDLAVTAQGGQSDSGLTVTFKRPDTVWTDQDFIVSINASNQLEDAFRSLSQTATVGFQRQFSDTLSAGYALQAQHARIDEKIDFRVYTLVGAPLFLKLNDTDDLINPTRGYRAEFDLTPYWRGIGSELTYAQGKATASTYRKLDEKGNYVVAVQGILGASCCASLEAIPKDHRLYAGGGGTVRGFGFQKAGPLDQYFNPIGGRSLLVGSLELRTRITDTIGLVPFLDAGSDCATPLPNFSGKIYAGAGIGLRYFTAIGPVRLDIATPLNPHSEGDSPIQIYVSLGQAF
jgi:translocation and assembly module TamA